MSDDMTPAEWFDSRKDFIGTHYSGCFKSHPDCAYWAGRREAIRELRAAVCEWLRDPEWEHNLPMTAHLADVLEHGNVSTESLRSLLPEGAEL